MIIAIASGKGGTGKTLVSTALALSVNECTYVDLDVEEPNGAIFLKPQMEEENTFTVPVPSISETKCTYCGACAKACPFNALLVIANTQTIMFFPELCHSCGVCEFTCPVPDAITETRKEIGIIRTGKRDTISFIEGRLKIGQPSPVPLISGIVNNHVVADKEALILFDSPPGTSCPVVETLKKSDYVILVTEPTPFGLNDLELMVELVQNMGKKACIIINKDNADNSLIDDFALKAEIPVMLKIPYSVDIQKAYSEGIPLNSVLPEIKEQLLDVLKHIKEEVKKTKDE